MWTAGFAYIPNPQMKQLDKALAVVCAGKSNEALTDTGERKSMETIMLGDRIHTRAVEKEMAILIMLLVGIMNYARKLYLSTWKKLMDSAGISKLYRKK